MQSLDIRGWALGSNRTQPDTIQPQHLDETLLDYAALKDETLQQASEALLYRLMGSSIPERGWGDYEIDHPTTYVTGPNGAIFGVRRAWTEHKHQGTYPEVHGTRLEGMRQFLLEYEGVVAVCNDAFGTPQELGHLLAEAHLSYTKWQSSAAAGLHASVTNEWAYQTALSGEGLMDLVRSGAVASQEAHFRYMDEYYIPPPRHYPDPETKAREQERTRQARERNRREAIEWARQNVERQYQELFDEEAATRIKNAQKQAFDSAQMQLSRLGADQNTWLSSAALWQAVQCYTRADERIDAPGGGAELTMQLSLCLSGSDSNEVGRQFLDSLDVQADNILTRLVSFNNESLHGSLQQLDAQAGRLPLTAQLARGGPESQEDAQAGTASALAGQLTVLLKTLSGQMTLGNRAISYIDAYKAASDAGQLRQGTWSLHISSLLSVKMVQGMRTLPATKVEARLLHFTALTGLSTLGSVAEREAQTLVQADQDRLRNVTNKVGPAAHRSDATQHVSGARSAGLAAVFNLSFAVLKGVQLTAKRDARTGTEMMGAVFSSMASILDFRIKAYELTVTKGQAGLNLFQARPMVEMTDNVHAKTLRAMRLTSFKFLLPASIITAFWGWQDAVTSRQRGNVGLAAAQAAGVLGTVFTVVSAWMTLIGPIGSIPPPVWALVAATLGTAGAVLALGTIVLIFLLQDEEWVAWLKDCPLRNRENKQSSPRKPVHDNLQDTLEKLVSTQASVQG